MDHGPWIFLILPSPSERPAPAVTGDVMVNQERRGESSHSTRPVTAEAGVQEEHFTSYFVFPHQFYILLPSAYVLMARMLTMVTVTVCVPCGDGDGG